MGQIINGKEVAFKLKESIKEFVNERREKNLKIKLPAFRQEDACL